jgi:hypothetical protein
VLIAIIRKELDLRVSLHTLLQILSLTMFEKTPLQQVLVDMEGGATRDLDSNQLNLFNS